MFDRLPHMLIKEFLQLFRDAKLRTMVFLMPLVQSLVFGYAVTTDVRLVPTAGVDFDQSVASRELLFHFSASGYFRFVSQTGDVDETTRLLDGGSVGAVLRIDRGFGKDLRAGRTGKLPVIVDGTRSDTAGHGLDSAGRG